MGLNQGRIPSGSRWRLPDVGRSYGRSRAGVTISDHHTESVRFLRHVEREERQGRVCPADWTWIVPPAASSATPVFHRYYQDFDQAPNFYRHPAPALPH